MSETFQYHESPPGQNGDIHPSLKTTIILRKLTCIYKLHLIEKGLDLPTIYNVYPSETFQYDGSPPGQIGDIHPSVHQRSFSRQVLQKSLF